MENRGSSHLLVSGATIKKVNKVVTSVTEGKSMEFVPLERSFSEENSAKMKSKKGFSSPGERLKAKLRRKCEGIAKKRRKLGSKKKTCVTVSEKVEPPEGENDLQHSTEEDTCQTNRLFVKMNKKITNESVIKELHPDIVSVAFPRKKNPRWCWAVFDTEGKALEALKVLSSRKGIMVSKPLIGEQKVLHMQKQLNKVNSRKNIKQKLKASWL